jgi:hypothetical protein
MPLEAISMCTIHLRRALYVAALFAITGCGTGTTGAGSAPGSAGLGALPGGFVHSGMPFAVFAGARSRMPQRAVRHNYATNASLVFEADQDEASVNVYQTSDLSDNPSPIATFEVKAGARTAWHSIRKERSS